jgi:LPPG:FO 2-phospho-L-lactate transferase
LITLLAGGTGSVKIARGLSKISEDLAIISNIADNLWLYGLYVCPDIDTITYGLANILDKERGWGIAGDSFMFLEQMKTLGQENWFRIGDRDLALHLVRTNLLKEGKSLSSITEWIRKSFSISTVILPSSDSHIETRIETTQGDMHIQEYWVKNHAEPEIKGIRYDGIKEANANTKAVELIRNSDLVVIAPGNPISSIGPIISMPSIRKELESRKRDVVAISPIIGNSALSGPASKYMEAMGIESSPYGVALHYEDIASNLIISEFDMEYEKKIHSLGIQTHKTNIVMQNVEDEIQLCNYIINKFNSA